MHTGCVSRSLALADLGIPLQKQRDTSRDSGGLNCNNRDTLMAMRPESEEIMRNVTVGAVQMSCSWDVQENIEKARTVNRHRWMRRES